jgi:hypothetical protein
LLIEQNRKRIEFEVGVAPGLKSLQQSPSTFLTRESQHSQLCRNLNLTRNAATASTLKTKEFSPASSPTLIAKNTTAKKRLALADVLNCSVFLSRSSNHLPFPKALTALCQKSPSFLPAAPVCKIHPPLLQLGQLSPLRTTFETLTLQQKSIHLPHWLTPVLSVGLQPTSSDSFAECAGSHL